MGRAGFLLSASGIWLLHVGPPKKVIHAGLVELSQLDEHIGGNIPLAQLIGGIAHLAALQVGRKVLLQKVLVLPQVPDPRYILPPSPFLNILLKV